VRRVARLVREMIDLRLLVGYLIVWRACGIQADQSNEFHAGSQIGVCIVEGMRDDRLWIFWTERWRGRMEFQPRSRERAD
jgi:hypothetical protein